jgi:hypothetical protein
MTWEEFRKKHDCGLIEAKSINLSGTDKKNQPRTQPGPRKKFLNAYMSLLHGIQNPK